jgi:hypothetical protein
VKCSVCGNEIRIEIRGLDFSKGGSVKVNGELICGHEEPVEKAHFERVKGISYSVKNGEKP